MSDDSPFAPETVTWLGHATVLLTTREEQRILFDPWLENPKAPASLEIDRLDAIAVTHGHFDHIGSVVSLAQRTGAPVVCVPEMAAYFSSVGVTNVVEMNKGGSVQVAGITLTMVTADHSCGISVGEGAVNVYGGNPVGFIVTSPWGQGGPIYISGDTNVFGDMALIRELYAPDTAFVPIDGYYNMGPREAAYAVRLLGVGRVVPIHYGTFPALQGTPAQLQHEMTKLGLDAVMSQIAPGEHVHLVSL